MEEETAVINREFGSKAKQLRRAKEMKQESLAEMIGIDVTYLSKIENGLPPGDETARKIIETLDNHKAELERLYAVKVLKDFERKIKQTKLYSQVKENLKAVESILKEDWQLLLAIIFIAGGIGAYLIGGPHTGQGKGSGGGGLGYKVLSETSSSCLISVKAEQVPSRSSLKTIAVRAWQNEKKNNILLYLPGMDTGSPAYGTARFAPEGLRKFKIHSSVLKEIR